MLLGWINTDVDANGAILRKRTKILVTAGAAVIFASAGGVAFAVSNDAFRPEAGQSRVNLAGAGSEVNGSGAEAPAVEAAPTETANSQPAANSTNSVLKPGTRFTVGQAVTSPDGRYKLIMQADGNLVFSESGKALWSSETHGNPGGRAEFQADGNLVVRAADGNPIFYTATGKDRGKLLGVQNDGNVVIYDGANKGLWSSKNQGIKLYPDQALHAKQTRVSSNGEYRLVQQTDGNLTVTQISTKKVMWASQTHDNPGAYTIMGGDGNLVVYSKDGKPLYVSATQSPGATFVMQNDGNAVVHSTDQKGVWGTTTHGVSMITKGQTMRPGQYRSSRNGQYRLQQQADGNLVLVHTQRGAIWSTNTAGNAGARTILQRDGNFVLQDTGNRAIFSANTHGTTASFVIVQDDGNVVLYDAAKKALWSTKTGGK
jgi:predicted lipoprotein with Yx(FWY)xxD motif